MSSTIKHDQNGGYYTLTINGKFIGNFDSVTEAAKELEAHLEAERNKQSA